MIKKSDMTYNGDIYAANLNIKCGMRLNLLDFFRKEVLVRPQFISIETL